MVGKKLKRADAASGKLTNDVTAFMARLEHPRKAEIETLRAIILGADSRIRESIKWNAPSFATTEHFATVKLRPLETVQIVFHTGAKVKPTATVMQISDPAAVLKWVAQDRCVATFSDMRDITSRQNALVAIVQQWIEQM